MHQTPPQPVSWIVWVILLIAAVGLITLVVAIVRDFRKVRSFRTMWFMSAPFDRRQLQEHAAHNHLHTLASRANTKTNIVPLAMFLIAEQRPLDTIRDWERARYRRERKLKQRITRLKRRIERLKRNAPYLHA